MKKFFFSISLTFFAIPAFTQQVCLSSLEQEVIAEINKKRKENGLSEVSISSSLMLTANKNVEEIVTESYISYKPEQLTQYRGESAEIRYLSNNNGNATQIVSSLSFESQYTNHHKILLNKEEFKDKNWKAVGICIRNSTIAIYFGVNAEPSGKINSCSEERFFGAVPLPPEPTYPTLEVFIDEVSFFSAYSIDKNGKRQEYRPIYISSVIPEGTNFRLPLDVSNALSFEVYIAPRYEPIVPQEPIIFKIDASEKGDVKKEKPLFKGNSVAEIEKYLSQKGVKIDQKATDDGNGYTLLHRAVAQNNIEAVAFLLRKGANINVLSNDKEMPINFCISNEMFKLLMTKNPDLKQVGVDGGTVLQSFAFNGVLDGVKHLVEKEAANINHQSKQGTTALYDAIFNQHYAVVEYLLSKGAKQLVSWGRTPIYEAIAIHDLPIVKLLVKYGANLKIVDEEGYTPLKYAEIFEKENTEIISYLKSIGAK